MADKINDTNQQKKKNAGCFGIGCSVLFPIVGIFLYFIQKKSVNDPSAYLYGALIGFVGGLLLRAITGNWAN
ncbi:MAG: hypothetical protein II260_08785 [Muribaculaceae bacterium]|nr:hypothetical protein [Muribaculaceae bacterium]